MIIRSGLIQNRPDVEPTGFARHWREVHGPLARKVPNLRGYVQNLVTRRVTSGESGLHLVDGISQLWFDDVDAMTAGTNSPEQRACIEDISRFLSGVTLAIQKPGGWARGALRKGFKLMAVFVGADAEAAGNHMAAIVGRAEDLVDYRVNPVAVRGVVVDEAVASSRVPIVAIAEAWFETDDVRNRVLDLLVRTSDASPVAAMAVTETVLMPVN